MRWGALLALVVFAGLAGVAWLVLGDTAPRTDAPTGPAAASTAGASDDDLPPALRGRKEAPANRPPTDVRITVVEGPEQAPVVGAEIDVIGISVEPPAPTNADGRTWVRRVPGGPGFNIDVRRARSLAPPQSVRVPAGVPGFIVELARARTVRGTIQGEGDSLIGSTVRVTRSADPTSPGIDVPVNGNQLVISGWGSGPVRAWVHAPDGRVASLRVRRGEDEGAVSFLPTRALRVRVRYDDDAPAGGVQVLVAQRGSRGAMAVRSTDTAGDVLFEALPAVAVDVGAQSAAGDRLSTGGRADLSAGDASLDITIRRPMTINVHMSGVADPETLVGAQVRLDGAFVDREVIEGRTLRVVWPWPVPQEPNVLSWVVPGYVPGTVRVPRGGHERDIAVALSPAATIHVRVLAEVGPSADPARFELERQDPEGDRWLATGVGFTALTQRFRQAPEGGMLIEELPPGRYRAVAALGLYASPPVETRTGRVARLDVVPPVVRTLRGRVVVPGVGSAREARVRLAMVDRPSLPGWSKPAPDGTFRADVPAGEVIEVSIEHPTWRMEDPDPLVVRAGENDIELLLVRQPVLRVRLKGDVSVFPRLAGVTRAFPVFYVKENERGEPLVWRSQARVIGHMATMAPPAQVSGACRIVLDCVPYQPMVFDNIVVNAPHDAARTWGTVTWLPHKPQELTFGRSIRVETSRPTVTERITATHLGPAAYVRAAKQAERVVRGLGPGRFRIDVYVPGHARPAWSTETELTPDDPDPERVVHAVLDD